ncbi:hypothetical protein F4826_002412 [Rahnella inusitata]|nr:hypothetical protein [Rahnella inusitata]
MMDVIRTHGEIAGLKAREQLIKDGKPTSDAAVM